MNGKNGITVETQLINGNASPRTEEDIKRKVESELTSSGLMNPPQNLTKASSIISDLDHNSSESERDSEIEFMKNKVEKGAEELPDERKGLCYEESFEEDFPYVPTTLPLEKSVAIPILPIKQRLQEVRYDKHQSEYFFLNLTMKQIFYLKLFSLCILKINKTN